MSIDLKAMGASTVWFNDLAGRIYALKHSGHSDTLSTNYAMWSKIDTLALGLRAKGANPQLKGESRARIFDNEDHSDEGEPEESEYEDVLVDLKVEVLTDKAVGPLTTTKWGQEFPWNQCSPFWGNTTARCLTGCVAVSGAQLLYYFHFLKNKPRSFYTRLDGEARIYDNRGNGYQNYRFEDLSESAWERMSNPGNQIEGPKLASILMTYVGLRIGMHYGLRSSTADDVKLVQLFSEFGIGSEYVGYKPELVRASLDERLPVNISAFIDRRREKILVIFKGKWLYSRGHSWIIDGYKEKETRYTSTYQRLPRFKRADETEPILKAISASQVTSSTRKREKPLFPYTYKNVHVEHSYYWKMNFGWDGSHDEGDYLTGEDGVWSTSNGGYQYNKNIIHNFTF